MADLALLLWFPSEGLEQVTQSPVCVWKDIASEVSVGWGGARGEAQAAAAAGAQVHVGGRLSRRQHGGLGAFRGSLQGGWTRHGNREAGRGHLDGCVPGDSSFCPETQEEGSCVSMTPGQAPARCWGQMSARSAASSHALRWWEAAAQKEASQAEDREAGVGPSAGADCLPRGTRDDRAALSATGMVLSRDLVEGISISV